MQRIIRKSFPEQDTDGEGDSEEAVWMADVIAQSYFIALRKAVPDQPEKPVVWGIPLNVSERILFSHIQRLNDVLCQLARAERWHACEELWDQALKLVSTFSEIALRNPEPFKRKARISPVMPSLRVPPALRKSRRQKAKWFDPYVGDSTEIAAAIELSANAVGAKISDNRTRLGGLCARLMGECVDEIKRARFLWSNFFTPYRRPVVWPTAEEIKPYRGMAMVDDVLADMRREPSKQPRGMKEHLRSFCLLADCGADRLHFLTLKELTKEEAPNWWKGAIETMVEERFPILEQHPSWARELKRVSSGSEADMRKELKDYCRDKVKQFG